MDPKIPEDVGELPQAQPALPFQQPEGLLGSSPLITEVEGVADHEPAERPGSMIHHRPLPNGQQAARVPEARVYP